MEPRRQGNGCPTGIGLFVGTGEDSRSDKNPESLKARCAHSPRMVLPSSEADRTSLTLKICLAGDQGVGKTSLVRRFVSNTFDDRYLATLGAKVSSRKFLVTEPGESGVTYHTSATVWDIMGNIGFRELLKDAYFYQSQALLLVCDSTRPETLQALEGWFNAVTTVAGIVPTVVLVNKSDLKEKVRVSAGELEELCAPRGWRWLRTSAKTGENVEAAFRLVTLMYLEKIGKVHTIAT